MSNLQEIVKTLSGLTIIEANELVKTLEAEWGVSAAAPVAVMAAAAETEAQTEFDVILANMGANKLNVIKEIRTLTGLGLGEAKALVEGAPATVKTGVSKDEAAKIKQVLEAAGATVEVK